MKVTFHSAGVYSISVMLSGEGITNSPFSCLVSGSVGDEPSSLQLQYSNLTAADSTISDSPLTKLEDGSMRGMRGLCRDWQDSYGIALRTSQPDAALTLRPTPAKARWASRT
jgi:hypothetical protein